ncbi:hypothetical protein T11_15023 [Trichinella zimbabwensis]|uniref:Uncharacterized protein n=1 Tax=Trichinella zimbabwensis TaxID=268475 RepID=A0A0V1GPQ2_9BILA|nr:hypothetical protein T11_15023 [Trichinella zimbabwensis]
MAATKEVSDLTRRVLTSLRNDILLNTNATAIMGWMVDFMSYFHRPILMAVHLNLKLDLHAVGLKPEGTALAYLYRWYIQPYTVQLSLAFKRKRVMYNVPDIWCCFAHAALVSTKSPTAGSLYYHIKRQRE